MVVVFLFLRGQGRGSWSSFPRLALPSFGRMYPPQERPTRGPLQNKPLVEECSLNHTRIASMTYGTTPQSNAFGMSPPSADVGLVRRIL